MKRIIRVWPVLWLALLAVPAHSEEPAPEQKTKSIEQEFISGNKRDAVKQTRVWLKAEPKSPWPKVASAAISFHQKKFNRCLSWASKALDQAPQNADGYYWRGRCYEAKGDNLDAANEYQAAIKAEAAHAAAHEGLTRVEPSLGTLNQ